MIFDITHLTSYTYAHPAAEAYGEGPSPRPRTCLRKRY